ncbi:hypothetical protein JTB14_016853 [Gonioctena quinquepunctata]|nr:hypothetical protein JTB14_016853 [Gonioctena quinquepunctata]
MSKAVLLILALHLSVISAQVLGPTCGENETMVCEGCSEELTCQNRYPKYRKGPCTKECILTCACNEGYIRDKYTKKCVLEEDCPLSL